jgi:hypothetical protein
MAVAVAAPGHADPFEFDRSTIQEEDANQDPASGSLECQGDCLSPASPNAPGADEEVPLGRMWDRQRAFDRIERRTFHASTGSEFSRAIMTVSPQPD